MNLVNVSNYKQHLILKCPIYFSKKIIDSLILKNQAAEIININLFTIPVAIWGQNVNDNVVIVALLYNKNGILKSTQMLCFAANFNDEICLICIEEAEVTKFNPKPKKRKGKPAFVGHANTVLNTFKRKDDILMLSPLIKKEKINLRTFFDESQVKLLVRELHIQMQRQQN